MYNVYNPANCFYLYDVYRERMILIGNEQEFIDFLAKAYKKTWWDGITNTYFDDFACSQGDVKATTRWQFFDGEDRCINPKVYERLAYSFYLKKYKEKDKKDYYTWRKNQKYKGTFRRTPVEGIHKRWRGGPCVKPRHIKPIIAMYGNPEYKEFNRGSHKEVPAGWWDDWHRHKEKNWKSQSKRRHQWKGDVIM